MRMIDDYLNLQEKYEKKYGPKTIVLYECGKFFEIYGVINDQEKAGKIMEIAAITNLNVTKKGGDKSKPSTRKNPLMAGFPNLAYSKWKNILLRHDYTIIKIEQDSHGTKDPDRKLTEIVSPGVNIDAENFTNILLSIHLEEIKDDKTNSKLLFGGVSSIDLATGHNLVYDILAKKNDINYTLDELFRYIQTNNPSEIIINTENLSIDKKEILNYLEINDRCSIYCDRP